MGVLVAMVYTCKYYGAQCDETTTTDARRDDTANRASPLAPRASRHALAEADLAVRRGAQLRAVDQLEPLDCGAQ
jgi:hypothetical protein